MRFGIPLATQRMKMPIIPDSTLGANRFLIDAAPIRHVLTIALCAFASVAILAVVIVKVDIYAVAQARIQPTGRSKVIQPIESGSVSKILVFNGAHVHAGDAVLELDSTDSTADRDDGATQLNALDAEIMRREAAITTVTRHDFGATAPLFDSVVDPTARRRAESVYLADKAFLRATLADLDSKIAAGVVRSKSLEATIAEQAKVAQHAEQLVAMWQTGRDKGFTSEANLVSYKQAYERELASLSVLKGQMMDARSSLQELHSEKTDVIAKFIDDNSMALLAAQTSREQVKQRLIKATTKLDHTRLTAPVDGTVQELATTTIGQVVAPGQPLMTIVPEEATFEVEALVLNNDIGFVELGQHVILKVETFPYTTYGTFTGTVTRISRDAVDGRDALPSANNSVLVASAQSGAVSPTPQMQSLVYPVTIALDRTYVTIDGNKVPLSAGMRATAEIRTGTRRAVDYLLAPIKRAVSESAHER